MTHEATHLDKLGRPLAEGDIVTLFYGGDQHDARVTALTRNLDADHVELELLSHATVPSGSVFLHKKAPPAPRTAPTTQDPKTQAHPRPHVNRPARTTRSK